VHDGRPSVTAVAAARHRATHQVLERGVVFSDPLAVRILGESESELLSAAAAHPERRPMGWFVCARARLAEDCLALAAERGIGHLVVLGAGLDTAGYRLRIPDLHVVEIDHPATQRWKLDLLVASGIDTSRVRYRAMDFERDDLAGH